MQFIFFILAVLEVSRVESKGIAAEGPRRAGSGAGLRAVRFRAELDSALGEVLGCGGEVTDEDLVAIEKELDGIFRAVPKVSEGGIDKRSLRYLVHRFFSRRLSYSIRGFEPSRPVTSSGWVEEDMLSQRVPAVVESFLQSTHTLSMGFTIRDAAVMVATLQQLISDSRNAVLEDVFTDMNISLESTVTMRDIGAILDSFMVHWMLGEAGESAKALLVNMSLLEMAVPHWNMVTKFVRGEALAFDFKRKEAPLEMRRFAGPGRNALSSRFSFEDTHVITGNIASSFASFWESECSSMKDQLIQMDSHHTGRVPLARFYSSGLDSEWRFGESESYLRELGALDESSAVRGAQVIIPNYIQATSNCIVSTAHYSVCCKNDCEAHLEDIEAAVGAPTAEPTSLLAIVGNLTSTLEGGEPPVLTGELTKQLMQIAESSGGEVTLHGRLFAQWLHFVFPRECPFPHKAGEAAKVSPNEYGEGYLATEQDMQKLASAANDTVIPTALSKDDLRWMSQWSPEEELFAEQAGIILRAPWEYRTHFKWLVVILFLGVVFVSATRFGQLQMPGAAKGGQAGALPVYGKAHFV